MTESELVKKALAGDEACKERLVVQYRALVYKLVKRYLPIFGEDAISLGFLGFWKGVRRFDSARGNLTCTVAPSIHGELREEMRKRAPIARNGYHRIVEAPLDNKLSVQMDDTPVYVERFVSRLRPKLTLQENECLDVLLAEEPVTIWAQARGIHKGRAQQIKAQVQYKAYQQLAA